MSTAAAERETAAAPLTANYLTASEALRRIRSGVLTSAELVDACLAQISRLDPELRAWTHTADAIARRTAAALDGAGAGGAARGLMAGIPVGVKDIFNTCDMPTAMGSPIWRDFMPGNDARVVTELRLAGAVMLGKTVTAEFAVHSPGETRNPHNSAHTPGTSSSGSAAAVAACMVPVALGTQTAGSVIRPASYCGVYGFKPSFGLVPRTGCLKTTDSLDTVGWFARSADDIELLFETLHVRGRDYPVSSAALEEAARERPRDAPWRVAFIRGTKWEEAEPYAQEAVSAYADSLSRHGIIVVEEELPPAFEEAHAVHATIYDKALSYYFKNEFAQDTLISPTLKSMIVHGQGISLDEYTAALSRQHDLALTIDQWFRDRYDVILTLSAGGEAPERHAPDRPDSCLVWTLCGLPALSIPVFSGPNRLPIGAQLVGRRYRDRNLFELTRALRQGGLAPEVAPRPLFS